MYRYNSVQTHTQILNGKSQTKTNRVSIKGKNGYKMVTVRNNKGTRKKKKKLTRKEMNCIKKCEFVPGLFSDCEKCL